MPQPDGLSTGQRLRRGRLAMNWSQERLAEALETSVMTVRRWEHNVVLPQPRFREQLCRLFQRSNEELFGAAVSAREDTSARPVLWTVPYLQNPYFVGRESILAAMHALLASTQPVALARAVALTGLGGVGKTQTAIEYAYRYASAYTGGVFWLAAETAESLTTSLQQIADLCQLPESQASGQPQMVTAVQRWFTTHQGWLLIGDNVEDLDLLQTVLPPARQGTLLLTTRCQTLGTLAELIELPPMSDEEGAMLVLRRSRRLGTMTQSELGPAALPDALETARTTELVRLLDGLPLALDQAGGYIEETGCGIADYLHRYYGQRKRLLARRGVHAGAHPASVTATLQLSVQWIEREHPAAVELLRLCAFLHSEAIPEELLVAGCPHLGPVLGPVMADLYQFDLTLAALRKASLVSRHPETRTLAVHRLVQAVLQDQMEPALLELWSRRAICVVDAAFPSVEFAHWPHCERCLAHALVCVPLIDRYGSDLPAGGEVLWKAGSYLMARGRYEEAQPLLVQALASAEHLYGPDHPALLPRLLRQAELCWRREEYEPAEQLLLRALALGEQHLSPTHPQIAEVLSDLAKVYRQQNRCEQAESVYQRALRIQERQLGSEYPETVAVLSHLADVYQYQGKYERAEPLYQRALRLQEQQSGPWHPQIAEMLNALATLYSHQGKYEQAEPLYLRALRIQEHQLRFEDPETAVMLSNLADLYRQQGRYEQAEPLYLQSLYIREQHVGPEHPEVMAALCQLASFYHEQGQLEQAEVLYQRALATGEQGSAHLALGKIRADSARLKQQRGTLQSLNGDHLEGAQVAVRKPQT
jgi:tetratricopeptide (TPR) repeat protein